jgi:hypothetical protein
MDINLPAIAPSRHVPYSSAFFKTRAFSVWYRNCRLNADCFLLPELVLLCAPLLRMAAQKTGLGLSLQHSVFIR